MLGALFSAVAALTVVYAGGSAKAADFSGAWTMDASRSESAHQVAPIGTVTLVIQMGAKEVTVETQRGSTGPEAGTSEVLKFSLDRTERIATGPDGNPVKCLGYWDRGNLVLETARTIRDSLVTTLQVYALSANGKELTVRKTLTVQHGYEGHGAKSSGSGTDVYVRAKKSSSIQFR